MVSSRKSAIAFGVMLIASIVCGIVNSVPAIEEPDYLAKLKSIEPRVIIAVFFQAMMAIIYMAITVITYPIVKMDSQRGATAYLSFRVTGAAFLFVGIVTLMLFLPLGRQFSQADAAS